MFKPKSSSFRVPSTCWQSLTNCYFIGETAQSALYRAPSPLSNWVSWERGSTSWPAGIHRMPRAHLAAEHRKGIAQDEVRSHLASLKTAAGCSLQRQSLSRSFQRRLYVTRTREPTFGACSFGGNVCYGKDAENKHTCVLRNHMHTAENKQNYSFPKYLRVESLQKASNLSCSSKIESRGRKEGAGSQFWGLPVASRQKESQI